MADKPRLELTDVPMVHHDKKLAMVQLKFSEDIDFVVHENDCETMALVLHNMAQSLNAIHRKAEAEREAIARKN